MYMADINVSPMFVQTRDLISNGVLYEPVTPWGELSSSFRAGIKEVRRFESAFPALAVERSLLVSHLQSEKYASFDS